MNVHLSPAVALDVVLLVQPPTHEGTLHYVRYESGGEVLQIHPVDKPTIELDRGVVVVKIGHERLFIHVPGRTPGVTLFAHEDTCPRCGLRGGVRRGAEGHLWHEPCYAAVAAN